MRPAAFSLKQFCFWYWYWCREGLNEVTSLGIILVDLRTHSEGPLHSELKSDDDLMSFRVSGVLVLALALLVIAFRCKCASLS